MGKAKKLRDCPVVGRGLLPHECASARNIAYACPEACEFNPMSRDRYDALLEIEDDVDKMLLGRLRETDPAAAAALLREIDRGGSAHLPHAASIRRLFFQRDAEGRSRADRWLADAAFKLKTDERVLIAAKARTRPALLEVQAVGRDGRLRMRDLLRPDAPDRDFVDRRLAGSVGRFSRLLGWVYSLPHFDRLSGTAIIWSEFTDTDFRPTEVLLAISAHLGGPPETGEALMRWIEDNFERVEDALHASQMVRRHDMASGGDLKWVRHDYVASADGDLLGDLRQTVHLRLDELTAEERAAGYVEAWGWAAEQAVVEAVASVAESEPMLGRLLRRPGGWRLTGLGVVKLGRARAKFEAVAGARVTWQGEVVENVGLQAAPSPTDEQLRLVPPRLREQPMRADFLMSRIKSSGSLEQTKATYMAAHWQSWSDTPLPALGGRAPREAAADPAGRARVIELMKEQVRRVDEDNLQNGTSIDINPLIRDLGLTEIDIAPPPPRPRPAPAKPTAEELDLADDDDDFDLEDFEDAEWRIGCSRMTEPYQRTMAQVLEDLQAVVAVAGAEEIVTQVGREVPDLLDWVVDEVGSSMDDEALDLLESEVATLWCALTPVGWADEAGFDTTPLDLEFKSRGERLSNYLDQPGALDDLDAVVTKMVGEPRNRLLKKGIWSLAMMRFKRPHDGAPIGMNYALAMGVLVDALIPIELPEA